MALLNDRFDIDPERPLPAYDTLMAKAYAAKGRGANANVNVIALVCQGSTAVRADLVSAQRSLTTQALLHVREGGAVDWPLSGQKHYAFIYDMPFGKRLQSLEGGSFTPIKEEPLITRIVPALGAALNELVMSAAFHGAIRPNNIFIAEEGAALGAMLGDNLTQLPGTGQGAVYDTIERAMAPEIARGAGGPADDYYALGVTLLAALIGETPLHGLDAQAIIQLKMEKGTYAALAGERRFSAALVELLRGLTTDDPKQRWGLEDFGLWLSGRRLTPKTSYVARRASRSLRFGAQDIGQMRQLMQVFPRDTRLAATLIRNDELERWISNGFGEDKTIKYLDEAKMSARLQRHGPEDERLVANAIIVLDPGGPIRYRGVSVFPAGIPAVFADTLIREGNVQILSELILNDLVETWLEYQTEKRPDIIVAVQQCEKAKQHLQNAALGSGPERALYEISPHQPCLSPLTAGRYVLTMKHLMEALERRAGQGPTGLMDRHIAGFMLARDRKILNQVMQAIDQTGDPIRRNVALLTLYSDLQHRFGPDKAKNIAAILLPVAEESAKRFHNRPRQDKVRKELRAAAQNGDLGAMLSLIDDPKALEDDAQQFEAARLLYKGTDNELQRLSLYSSNKKALASGAGQPLAAALSVFIAFVVLVVIVLQLFN